MRRLQEGGAQRRWKPGILLPVAGLLLVSTMVRADVVIDHDPAVDFSPFRTFAWLEGTAADDPKLEKHVRVAVERELVAQGFKEARDDPDLLILTHAAMDTGKPIEVGEYPYWPSYEGWKKPVAMAVDSLDLVAGTFIVDILDASSERLIWRGLATGILAKKPEKRDHRINQAAGKMFRKFPPR